MIGTELALPSLLLVLGLGSLGAEVLLPTGGVLGVLAALCFVGLLYLGFSTSTTLGVGYLVAELLLVPSTYGLSLYLVARTDLGRRAFLRPPEAHEVDLSREGPNLHRLVGRRGRALTTLRPSGKVDFEGQRLDGVAEEGLIPAGAPVLVVRVRSGRLIVRLDHEGQDIPAVDE